MSKYPILDPNKDYTEQEIALAGLRYIDGQKRKCMDVNHTCMYQRITSEGEERCVVGAMMGPEHKWVLDIQAGWFAVSLRYHPLERPLPQYVINNRKLMCDLQAVHDASTRMETAAALKRVLEAYNIKYKPTGRLRFE